MTQAPGYSEIVDLAAVGDEDLTVVLRPTAAQCAGIAEWLGAIAVETLEAEITLSRRGDDLYRYEARFAADVVQACVVTLEPVHARLEGDFHRLYALIDSRLRHRLEHDTGGGALSLADEDPPETIETTLIDVAVPVLEELSLTLDPYPRASGVQFEPPAEPESPAERPFAALEKLKAKFGGGEPGEGGAESGAKRRRGKPLG